MAKNHPTDAGEATSEWRQKPKNIAFPYGVGGLRNAKVHS